MINERALILESCQAIVCGALLLAQIAGTSEVPIATQSPSPWLMFHHDESHTGVANGEIEWSHSFGGDAPPCARRCQRSLTCRFFDPANILTDIAP